VFLFPRRRLHLVETGANDHLHIIAAKAARGSAAIHRRIAAAEDDDLLANLVDMAERNIGQPVDPDLDVRRGGLAAGNIEVATARRAGADEDRIVALGENIGEAVDAAAETGLGPAHVEDIV